MDEKSIELKIMQNSYCSELPLFPISTFRFMSLLGLKMTADKWTKNKKEPPMMSKFKCLRHVCFAVSSGALI